MKPLRIFLSTSWRNEAQPYLVKTLREAGYEVYDFRENKAFHWSELDPEWESWSPQAFKDALEHTTAREAFFSDFGALDECDVCLMVQPCGRSASLELGYAVGIGIHAGVILAPGTDPELMLKMTDHLAPDLASALEWLSTLEPEYEYAGGLVSRPGLRRLRHG